jgi:hypothetical protein
MDRREFQPEGRRHESTCHHYVAAELLSRKNTNPPSGFSDTEFAADCFFNLFACAAVVLRQLVG